jgi:lauroyl/myristoyl acyltransferase
MERHLPPRTLCSLLKPFAFARATFNTAFKDPRPPLPWPDCVAPDWTRSLAHRRRMNRYLNSYLQYFPDRLADPKWKDNCRIIGGDGLLKARLDKRPVVVVFCHFGPIFFMRPWLRAAGIPSGILVVGNSEDRLEPAKKNDALFRYPHIPPRFHLDQLKQAAEFLAAGNILFIAIDVLSARQMEVPFCAGWTFQMPTGAVRLAIHHQAELIPCTIIDEGSWRFRIEIGGPVPEEFLTAKSDYVRAGKHLLAEMLPHFQAHREQCGHDMLIRLRKG